MHGVYGGMGIAADDIGAGDVVDRNMSLLLVPVAVKIDWYLGSVTIHTRNMGQT